MRVIFAGTPDIAEEVLKGILNSQHEVVAVLTQPDRPAGRGKKLLASPVKQLALEHDIPVLQPESFKKNPESIEALKSLKADVMIVVAYGLILPSKVLTIPKHGCLNIHVSLLPKWRGAAPIQRAILAGDSQTGVTIMQMDKGLDTGDILYVEPYTLQANETSQTLHDALAHLSAPAVLKVLSAIEKGELNPTPQPKEGTYAHKMTKEEAKINWEKTAGEIERCIRGYNPWPVAYMEAEQQTIKVWGAKVIAKEGAGQAAGTVLTVSKAGIEVATSDGVLCLTHLQFPNKKMMAVADILNGKSLDHWVGQKLS